MLRSAIPKLAANVPRRARGSIQRRALHQVRPASSAAARILVERTIERAQAATGSAHEEQESSPESSSSAAEAHTLPAVAADERKVSIGWHNKVWSKFHHIWLRDHCRCPECFHPVTKQRMVDTFSIRADVQPTKVESTRAGLEVTWPSSPTPHISLYPWTWLRHNSYDPFFDRPRTEKVLWGAGIAKDPPMVEYEQVMQDDKGLWRWLKRIDRFGFCFVNGVPPTAEATEEVIKRIAFLRETHYGKFWEFTSDATRGDTAYTSMALGAHTDGTYYTDPIGLQFLHLLSHTEGSGGASLLVDGFYAASLLRELYPSAFDVLSRTRLAAHAAGEEGVMYRTGTKGRGAGFPIIETVPGSDDVVGIRYNNDDRSALQLPPDEVEEFYDALRLWNKTLTSPDSEYWVQLAPGTLMAFDNQRTLHGRAAFTGKRHMCGAYMGKDDFRSRLATLTERFGPPLLPADDGVETKQGFEGRTWGGLI
ncbi:Trimethyllysine dioxygenase [Exidia glandulosa HHB12029]|uniref:trimethyllysine dioxygenase n=1 Tax=Exidia glandulosa HHB12029 TaxID=1314781 RepID=A0A165ZZP2_EXIGL|nr:Trimethyllysine dioxygenase [Exidia glandulosa HHB12029]